MSTPMNKNVLLAMSGGIDSSAAAVILKEKGYAVTGYTFRIDGVSSDAVERAGSICEKLGIDHIYDDITGIFNEKVIQYFRNEYENGRTPNPCIRCNREIKFGIIYDYAMSHGYDYVATGHYASIIEKNNDLCLARSVDQSRDQTYFLYVLKAEQLRHILFPLNGVPKSKARIICADAGLLPAESKESREICFVPDKYKDYLTKTLGATSVSGDFVNKDGSFIKRHDGILNYTIGQRKGLGIHLGKPGYILSIDPADGKIVIGDEVDLYKDEFMIGEINLINGKIHTGDELYVKIRYSAKPERITSMNAEEDKLTLHTENKLRAVTPGQSAVIYCGDTVVGGGVIL